MTESEYSMSNIAVLGASFGDEGKGRIVHDFSPNYDWVIRFNGGANAGHTIYRDGVKYVHNLMPSFDWRSPRPKAFLSSGMVIDLEQLHKEVKMLFEISKEHSSRVYVDPDVFLVLPEHKAEDRANNKHIGSTNRGIGPAYKSKIGRSGTRLRDVLSGKYISSEFQIFLQEMQEMGVKFLTLMQLRSEMGLSDLLFEGAQGIMLDINHGIYPYVSCSESTIAGIYSCGFNFSKLDKVYGVVKCYTTKVGEGPFPTEIFGEEANLLREKGQEYGATTGRPRRIGWIDLPALDYACQKGGITDLIITKFDILNGMSEIPLCTSYDKYPVSPCDFFDVKPNYEKVAGWNNASVTNDLKSFIDRVEMSTTRPVSFISFGVNKEDMVAW